MQITTPKKDYVCNCDLAKDSFIDLQHVDGKLVPVVQTGVTHESKNKTDPPVLKFDMGSLLGSVDALKRDDVSALYGNLCKVFSEPLRYTKVKYQASMIQKSEAQVQYVMSNMVDYYAHGNLEYVNPSRGTVHRLISKWPGLVRFTRDVSPSYKASIKEMLDSSGLAYDDSDWKIDSSVFYYLSYNGTLGRKMGMKHYMGYEVNPSALVNAGLCTSVTRVPRGYVVAFERSGRRKEFTYSPGDDIISVDMLHKVFRFSENFRSKMGLMHDLYTSEKNVLFAKGEITDAVQLTYGCRVLEGDYHHTATRIFDSTTGEMVYQVGSRAHSCVMLHPAWHVPSRVRGLSTACYMLSYFTGTVTFLGKKKLCRPCNERTKDSFRYKGKYYHVVKKCVGNNVFAFARGKIVPVQIFPYRLMDGVGHDYCTSSFENVVSVGMDTITGPSFCDDEAYGKSEAL